MNRMYPLYSLRDWREACSRSQVRANRQRMIEPFLTLAAALEGAAWAGVVIVLLWLAKVVIPVAT